MLTEKVDYIYATDLIAAQDAPGDFTVFAKPLELFDTKPLYYSKPAKLGNDPVWDSADSLGQGVEGFYGGQVIDTYSVQPSSDGAYRYSPELAIPSVLGIETTDKTSTGVYETPLLPRNDTPTAYGYPVDATPLNNDATDGLTTFQNLGASPLGTGYSGGSAYTQPTDPMPVAIATPQDEQPLPGDACAWYDFPCKFEKVKGETTVLVIGVILLAVGVFALTR